MTTQKLGAHKHAGLDYYPKNLSLAPSIRDLSALFHNLTHIDASHFPRKDWLKFGCVSLIGVGVAVTTYQIFKRYLRLSKISAVESKKEEVKRRFVEKLLKEADEISLDNFNCLMVDGEKSFNQKSFDDAEKQYAEALKIISGKDVSHEAECAKKLGAVYLESAKQLGSIEDKKEACIKASGLLNYALRLACKHNEGDIKKMLAEVESTLYTICKVISPSSAWATWDDENRKELKDRRDSIESKLDCVSKDPKEIKDLSEYITSRMKDFIVGLVDQTLQLLRSPPQNCGYAIVGLGSMARGEMTPFSDVEFAILVEEGKDTDEVKKHFQNLTYLMHLRVLNLGETIVPKLGIKALEGFYDRITPNKFAFDGKGGLGRGYMTPLGKKGVFELIQTPTKMAGFQGKNGDQYWYEQEPLLPTELHNITFIYGKKELVDDYRKELKSALKEEVRENHTLRSYYAQEHLFLEDAGLFEPCLGWGQEGMLFEIKKDLYRMPHLLIERLFLWQSEDLSTTSDLEGTFSKIDWLAKEGVFCALGAEKVKKMFACVLLARLKNSYEKNSVANTAKLIIQPFEDIDEEVYRVNYLFCWAVKESIIMGRSLRKDDFYTTSPLLLAKIKMRFGLYQNVEGDILKQLESNPSHVEALLMCARSSYRLGREEKALCCLSKATKIIKESKERTDVEKAVKLSAVGLLYMDIGDLYIGSKLIEDAYELTKDNRGAVNFINPILNNLALTYLYKRDTKKALEILEKGLFDLKSQCHLMNPSLYKGALGTYQKNLSKAYQLQNRIEESINYAKQSLVTFQKVFGNRHPQVAEAFADLGHLYFSSGIHGGGIRNLLQAFNITKEAFGVFHQTTILSCLTLVSALNAIDRRVDRIIPAYLDYAEKIETVNISFYHAIASTWLTIEHPSKAKAALQKSRKLALNQKSPIDLASTYYLFACMYEDCGRKRESLAYFEASLIEYRKAFNNEPNRAVVTCLEKLASSKTLRLAEDPFVDQKAVKESVIKMLKEAELMSIEISKSSNACALFSGIYFGWGFFEQIANENLEESANYFIKSIRADEELYGSESVHLVEKLQLLCQTYLNLPCVKKEWIVFFKKLLYLSEKHFDTSSPEYNLALNYINKFSETK